MIHYLFQLCVASLVWSAKLLGTTYETINVVLFVFAWPAFTLWLLWRMCYWRARAQSSSRSVESLMRAFMSVSDINTRSRLLPGMRFMDSVLTEHMLQRLRVENQRLSANG